MPDKDNRECYPQYRSRVLQPRLRLFPRTTRHVLLCRQALHHAQLSCHDSASGMQGVAQGGYRPSGGFGDEIHEKERLRNIMATEMSTANNNN